MPKFTTKLIARSSAAEGTMNFFFDRPANFNFKAGQFFTVILPNPPHTDVKGNRRTFSIASAPQEIAHLHRHHAVSEHVARHRSAQPRASNHAYLLQPQSRRHGLS